jgi:hypothetical protein
MLHNLRQAQSTSRAQQVEYTPPNDYTVYLASQLERASLYAMVESLLQQHGDEWWRYVVMQPGPLPVLEVRHKGDVIDVSAWWWCGWSC